MDNLFPSHIKTNECGTQEIQSVQDHCRNTAKYASESLECVRLSDCAYLAGLLHDMGKFTEEFRKYIKDAADGVPVVRGSVNHTFAGVRYIQTGFSGSLYADTAVQMLTKDLLSFAAGAHHGLFDVIDENGRDGIGYRINKENIHYEEAVQNFLNECAGQTELDALYKKACSETEALVCKIRSLAAASEKDKSGCASFYLGLSGRLLLSAVIDADRKDTAQFMQDTAFPDYPKDMTDIWQRELKYAERKITVLDASSQIGQARMTISDQCRKMADLESGLYRLNVPTGSGKTISSVRFALAHAAKWNKKRIIFTAPLLSILEQNADVIKSYISDPSIILEHHSNAVQNAKEGDELSFSELYMENWDAPVIITTLVQLLNTMFSGETRCIRRFYSLADSVIIIDEVQSVPSNMLTLFNLAVSFLVKICGATVMLCSATQPYLEGTQHPIAVKPADIFPYDPEIWKVFHRNDLISAGRCREKGLLEKVRKLSEGAESVLVICNKKSESEALFHNLSKDFRCFHISAAMCMEHRRKVLSKLRECLNDSTGKPVICVSTQVMEAGVDISFERVIRLMAGMDSCVQAAGRCNRNGEREEGKVFILECTDENLDYLSEIKRGKNASRKLIYEYGKSPERFKGDLSSEESIKKYYQYYYSEMPAGFQDFNIQNKNSIYSLLSSNAGYFAAADTDAKRKRALRQAFKEAGGNFHVFDEDTVDVIVPYEKGKSIISDLQSDKAKNNQAYCRELLRQANGYTVTLYPGQFKKLEGAGAIIKTENPDIYVLSDKYYDRDTGVSAKKIF